MGRMEPRHLLVAIDGSEASAKALQLAFKFLAKGSPSMTLISVVPLLPEFSRHPDLAEPLLKRLRQDAQVFLKVATEEAKGRGVAASGFVLEGHPVDEICGAVERDGADLVVLGSRGLGKGHERPLGSVGYNVAHLTRVSVLIARGRPTVDRILLPVDGSAAAARASEWAADVALAQGAAVTLLYVIPQGTEEVKFTVSRGVSEPFLGPLEKALRGRGITVTKLVEYGHPAEVIVDAAREGRFDLVVVGAQGRGAAGGFTLGGVTDKVLHFAPCSTLVVR